MAELVIRSVQKTPCADWLHGSAISFSYRLASFDKKITELICRQTNQIQICFRKDEQQTAQEVVKSP